MRKFILFILACGIGQAAVPNIISFTNRSGATLTNFPKQLGRVFESGEIAAGSYPQIGQCSTSACTSVSWLTTQADLKSAYGDGSVKHAIMSYLIPSAANGVKLYFTFRTQVSGNNTALTKTEMLDAAYDFETDVVDTFAGPVTASAAARVMLSSSVSIPSCETINWNTATGVSACYWLKGQINTTIVLVDHTTAHTYDFGGDAFKSIRPMFIASFWPSNHSVKVRIVSEIGNSTNFQDQIYSTVIHTGLAAPTVRYSHVSFTHYAGSRWTKTFWIGTTPTEVYDEDLNIAYMAESISIPNYDTSLAVPSGTITTQYTAWTSAAKDIFDGGLWNKNMRGPGARPDIAPIAGWYAQWLYSGGDYRMREIAYGQANLASAWPLFMREGNASKEISSGVNGLGRPASIWSRPSTRWVGNVNQGAGFGPYSYTYSGQPIADQITVVGAVDITNAWIPDGAHTVPAFAFIYQVTGDYYYIDCDVMWQMRFAHGISGALTTSADGRGPTGKEGGYHLGTGNAGAQMRAVAWTVRGRVESWYIIPDAMPEKVALSNMITEGFGQLEGSRNITTGIYNNNTMWTWGHTYVFPAAHVSLGGLMPPLGQWQVGEASFVAISNQGAYGIDPRVLSKGISLFEQDFMVYAFGRAKELGWPTDALLTFLSPFYFGLLTDPGSTNHYLIGSGRAPTVKSDGTYIANFAEFKSSFFLDLATCVSVVGSASNGCSPGNQYALQTLFAYDYTVWNGYQFNYMVAMSMLKDVAGWQSAWNVIVADGLPGNSVMNADPQWAILPRTVSVPIVPVSARISVTGKITFKGNITVQ